MQFKMQSVSSFLTSGFTCGIACCVTPLYDVNLHCHKKQIETDFFKSKIVPLLLKNYVIDTFIVHKSTKPWSEWHNSWWSM